MSVYTDEVRKVFKTIRPPYPGFIVDIVEYPNTLILRVYRDNVESFSESQKVECATYLYFLQDSIRQLGVACHIQGAEDAPPNWRR